MRKDLSLALPLSPKRDKQKTVLCLYVLIWLRSVNFGGILNIIYNKIN